MKENQKLKHLNSDSTHSKHCTKAIPHGLFKRLAKLTSINKRIVNRRIDELYPDHAEALKIAGLSPKKFPSPKEISFNVNNDVNLNPNPKQKTKRKIELLIFALASVKLGLLGILGMT